MFDKMEVATCNSSINDTAKFVYGHTEAFGKSAVEIASLTRGFKYKPCL